jgi:hypothetical protein
MRVTLVLAIAVLALSGCVRGPQPVPQLGLAFADLGLVTEPAFVCGGDWPEGVARLQDDWPFLTFWFAGELTAGPQSGGDETFLYYVEDGNGCRLPYTDATPPKAYSGFVDGPPDAPPGLGPWQLFRIARVDVRDHILAARPPLLADCPSQDAEVVFQENAFVILYLTPASDELWDCAGDALDQIEMAGPVIQTYSYLGEGLTDAVAPGAFLITEEFGVVAIPPN